MDFYKIITWKLLDKNFKRTHLFNGSIPVWCTTPEFDACTIRFYDTSPFSPSGRYIAVTRLPFDKVLPSPGNIAEIVVIDLLTGEYRVVSKTRAWDVQLGAQVQWGTDDVFLYYNDMDISLWQPYGVKHNLENGIKQRLDGTVYMVSPDGTLGASPCLKRIAKTQLGYGVIIPLQHIPENVGFVQDDGLYIIDLITGKKKCVASYYDIGLKAFPDMSEEELEEGHVYGFHAKWNPQGTRLLFVIRQMIEGKKKARSSIVTMKPDGTDIKLALHWRFWNGHHPNWHPDGMKIIMNIKDAEKILRFAEICINSQEIRYLSKSIIGSGHPTINPNNGFILTDAKPKDCLGRSESMVPLRLIDPVEDKLVTIGEFHFPDGIPQEPALRVDLHPAWDNKFEKIAVNAAVDGFRRVYIMDLGQVQSWCWRRC